jgi:hypothetical protein
LTELGQLIELGGVESRSAEGISQLVAGFTQAVLGFLADAQFLLLAVLREGKADAVGDKSESNSQVGHGVPRLGHTIGQNGYTENQEGGKQVFAEELN